MNLSVDKISIAVLSAFVGSLLTVLVMNANDTAPEQGPKQSKVCNAFFSGGYSSDTFEYTETSITVDDCIKLLQGQGYEIVETTSLPDDGPIKRRFLVRGEK